MVNLIFYSSTRGEKGGEKKMKKNLSLDDRRRDVSLRKKRRGCDETTRGKTEEKRAGVADTARNKQTTAWLDSSRSRAN